MEVKRAGGINFGPYVQSYEAHKGLIDGLLDRANIKLEGNANHLLAGIIKDQRAYDNEDKRWFVKEFQPYVSDYARGNCDFRGGDWVKGGWTEKFNLMNLWVNNMTENEVNPIHHHSGQITWVIYLETPDLEKERQEYKGRSVGPGGICFHYGEPQYPEWAIHTNGSLPKKGDIWIFPCLLRHEVIPFKTPGTRISVSGNLFFKNPNEESDIMEIPNS